MPSIFPLYEKEIVFVHSINLVSTVPTFAFRSNPLQNLLKKKTCTGMRWNTEQLHLHSCSMAPSTSHTTVKYLAEELTSASVWKNSKVQTGSIKDQITIKKLSNAINLIHTQLAASEQSQWLEHDTNQLSINCYIKPQYSVISNISRLFYLVDTKFLGHRAEYTICILAPLVDK